jgi:cell division septation protein DedD
LSQVPVVVVPEIPDEPTKLFQPCERQLTSMKTWVRKTLSVGALAAGAMLFAPAGAAFASTGHSTAADTAKQASVSSTAKHFGPGHDRRHSRHQRFGNGPDNLCVSLVIFGGDRDRGCGFRASHWGRPGGWFEDDLFGSDYYWDNSDYNWDDSVLCEDGVRRSHGHLAGHHASGYPTGEMPATYKPATHKPHAVKPATHKPNADKPATTTPSGYPTAPATTPPTGTSPATSTPATDMPAGEAPATSGYQNGGGRSQ